MADNASDSSLSGCVREPAIIETLIFKPWLIGFRQLNAIRVVADGSLDERPVLPDTESTCNIDGIAELLEENFVVVESANGLVDPDILINGPVSIWSIIHTVAWCNRSLGRTKGSANTFDHQVMSRLWK